MPATNALRARYATNRSFGFWMAVFFAAQGTQHDFGFALKDFFCRFGQLQGLMLLDVDGEIAQADALADNAAPFLVGLFAADAECG